MCSSVDYYVCFRDTDKPQWYMKLLKEGFRHCFVIANDRGKWIKYESANGILSIDIINDYDSIIESCIIIKVKGQVNRRSIILNTCVGFVKSIIGGASGAFTPYQLYKRLICR